MTKAREFKLKKNVSYFSIECEYKMPKAELGEIIPVIEKSAYDKAVQTLKAYTKTQCWEAGAQDLAICTLQELGEIE